MLDGYPGISLAFKLSKSCLILPTTLLLSERTLKHFSWSNCTHLHVCVLLNIVRINRLCFYCYISFIVMYHTKNPFQSKTVRYSDVVCERNPIRMVAMLASLVSSDILLKIV